MRTIIFIFFIFLFTVESVLASGSGTVGDPYTTLAEIASATCNNTIYLKNATYTAGDMTLSQACTSSTPLVIKCSNGAVESKGSCIHHDGYINITGSYITIDGMDFTQDANSIPIEINGTGANHNTVTDCRFTNINGNGNGVTIGRSTNNNTYNTISRCLFQGTWDGYHLRVRYNSTTPITGNTNNTITRNVFLNIENPYPIIQLGDGAAWSDDYPLYTDVTYNLFKDSNLDNATSEILEIKTSNNKINYNTFNETGGNVSLRAGSGNEVIGNIFKSSTNNGSYFTGVRVSGANHKIINNYFEGYEATCGAGDFSSMGIVVYWGGATCGGSGFPLVSNVLITNNTIKNTCRGFGMYQYSGDGSCPTAPTGVTYLNNLAESNVTDPNYEMFGGGNISVTGNTWTTNRGHTHGQVLVDPTISSGVTDSGDFELTLQKTGLPVNWYYPSTYTNGTYNANVTTDIQKQARADPPDIGCDESGGGDSLIGVGPSWTGGYQIQGSLPLSMSIGAGSLSITKGGSLSISIAP